jgi:hypothetical protein
VTIPTLFLLFKFFSGQEENLERDCPELAFFGLGYQSDADGSERIEGKCLYVLKEKNRFQTSNRKKTAAPPCSYNIHTTENIHTQN